MTVEAAVVIAAIVAGSLTAVFEQVRARPQFANADVQRTAKEAAGEEFARSAAASSVAEVWLATLAQRKATSPEVKALAAQIQADHTRHKEALDAATAPRGWRLPSVPAAEETERQSRLEKLEGAAFDSGYVDAVVASHEKQIAAFEAEATGGDDQALKAFATTILPKLQEHLQMAKSIQKMR